MVEDPHEAGQLLQSDIDRITDWSSKWLVKFNPAKTESLLISRKVNKPQHPQLHMLNQPIIEVDSHKHLGIHLTNTCTWKSHISYTKGQKHGQE